jgi:hypothetical protein
MREVYQGQLGYQDTFWAKGQNVVWDLVDNVVVTFAPNLSRTHEYEVENLLSKYFITQNQVSEPNIWLKNPNAELMELIEQYKGKNIILNDIWFQPGQPGAGRFLNIGSYIWGENSTAEWGNTEMRVFPNEKIDHRSMQTQLKAFFEYFGNYLADKVAGFEYYQYAPWADAKQFKFPSNHNSLAYQSVIKAMGLLNYTPEAEEIISRYISREWGFRTLHYGTDRSDQLAGSEADDKFFDSLGSDTMDGGVGLDTVRFTGNLVNYSIDTTANSVLIQKPGNGQDHLANVERLLFDDRAVALDTDRTAGKSYRIYKAAFNRTPDTGGLGYWIAQMDKGMDVVSVAARFIDSPEFRSLYGQNPTNAEFLTKVYSNVLARTPDAAGLDWWVNEMKTNPTKTWQKVLADFSESTENQANVASLIANGIEYAPWTG